MSDIIRLLPDSVANQIAAGEVIQRPASAIKEMLENSIDSGATQIKLIIKDAGKTLIQVIDNGCGMSETDARMSFERHATSKIREANDLFAIRTLGFRGEALASIAAIAQVELKTRKEADEVGTCVVIEGSKVKSQEPVAMPKGTSISVKNLFFNVPARRNFLKSDTVELRHIFEEFQRVALVHPDIEFSFINNEKTVFQLTKGNIKQRIIHLFGNQMNEKLIPVEMNTEMVQITGYIGKPEAARKTRGEQYFFANGRFIRHAYLHHAVEQAFEELIPDSAIPSYFLYIEVEPDTIDINIHPTKTEVNFQHSQLLYASIRTAVKHSIGMFTLSPTLDFDSEPTFDFTPPRGYEPKEPTIITNPNYNPFAKSQSAFKATSGLSANRGSWEKLYPEPWQQQLQTEAVDNELQAMPPQMSIAPEHLPEPIQSNENLHKLLQVQNRYILSQVKSGLLVIDQQKALARIIFEKLCSNAEEQTIEKQQIMFLQPIEASAADLEIIQNLMPDLEALGFEISLLGGNSFVINAIPANLPVSETGIFIDSLLEDVKKEKNSTDTDKKVKLARLVSGSISVKQQQSLSIPEMQQIIDELFACSAPEIAPDGSKIMKILNAQDLEKLIR